MSIVNAVSLLAAAGGDYTISRSVRLRSSASAYFSRTPASAGNRTTWTWSGWVKRGGFGYMGLFDGGATGPLCALQFSTTDNLRLYTTDAGITTSEIPITTAVYRDPSAHYHVVCVVDTTQATLANRVKIYVNGVDQTLTGFTGTIIGLNSNLGVNRAVTHNIGRYANGASAYLDGYLTEINFIDGQALTPSSFGETDSITGVWKPKKYAGTYGTNGFYLNFSDNSGATATTIGKDYSGNGNNWTPNNISVTSGATYDSMLDVPTQWADGGNGRGNYAVLNPLLASVNNGVLSNANLTTTLTATTQVNAFSNTPMPTSGKWYFEATVVSNSFGVLVGIRSVINSTTFAGAGTGSYGYYNANGNKYDGATGTAYGTAWFGASRTDTIGVAYDADTRELSFYLNGVSQGVAFTVAVGEYYPGASHVSGSGSHTEHWNFGQRPFSYTPPSGFKALNTLNLPTPTILKGNQYFDATTYTGNGAASRTFTGLGFQPDLIWTKNRDTAGYEHILFDSVRGFGVSKDLSTNTTNAEGGTSGVNYGYVSAATSDGYTVIDGGGVNDLLNQNGKSQVAWQWKEGATQGFDIVTYTGTGVNRTVAHNLGVAPSFMIVKARSSAGYDWRCYHSALGATKYIDLQSTAAAGTASTVWQDTAPTSSVFSVGTNGSVNANTITYVAYLFAEVAGFSRFGSYTGNGSADGPFVWCGFRPRFLMIKPVSAIGNWEMIDTARDPINPDGLLIRAQSSAAEVNGSPIGDILSNGFKARSINGTQNDNGVTYIFAAFAENPFKYALAR